MAARTKRIRHDDNTRSKIQATQIINRLHAHVMGKLKKPMNASQVTAASVLLKKVLPDLIPTSIQDDVTEDIAVISAEPMSDEEWEATYGNPDGVAPTNGSTENTH